MTPINVTEQCRQKMTPANGTKQNQCCHELCSHVKFQKLIDLSVKKYLSPTESQICISSICYPSSTDVDILGRNLKKQMEHASNAKLAIIVGPDELKEGNVVLRDMTNGTEGTIPLEKLTEDPNSVLNLEKL